MKQLSLLFSALFCLAVGQTFAQQYGEELELGSISGWGWSKKTIFIANQEVPQLPASVKIPGSWGDVKLYTGSFDANEYPGFKVALREQPAAGSLQFYYRNAAQAASYGGSYLPWEGDNGGELSADGLTFTGTFKLENLGDDPVITELALQNRTSSSVTVIVEAISLIDKNGNEVPTTGMRATGWNPATITPLTEVEGEKKEVYEFSYQYGEIGVNFGEVQVVEPGMPHVFTLVSSEPIPAGEFQWKTYREDGSNGYPSWTIGPENVVTYEMTENYTGISIQHFISSTSYLPQDIKLYRKLPVSVANPEFSQPAGIYKAPLTVELTCETEGADIYYTLDESEPTAESTLYTEPIVLEETTTVKAVAIDADGHASEVVSQKYVVYSFIKAQNIAFAKACNLETPVELTLKNAVVLAVGNRYCVVRDATGALNLYGSNLDVAVGNRLNGNVKGVYTKFNGIPQISSGADYADITITEGDEPEATLLAIDEVAADVNILQLVKIENAVVEKDGNNWYAVSGNDRIQIYDTFKAGYTLEEGQVLESLTGIVIPYQRGNTGDIVYELAPRNEDDIVVDEVATGISETMAQRQDDGAIYTLDGRRVKTPTAKGIYIIGGKKTVLR